MSGRSCSLARMLFFIAQPFRVDELPHRTVIDLETTLGRQLGHQPAQGKVGHPAALDKPITVLARNPAWLVASHLTRLDATGPPKPIDPADRGTHRHTETRRRPIAGHAPLHGRHHAPAQVLRIGCCHRCWPPSSQQLESHRASRRESRFVLTSSRSKRGRSEARMVLPAASVARSGLEGAIRRFLSLLPLDPANVMRPIRSALLGRQCIARPPSRLTADFGTDDIRVGRFLQKVPLPIVHTGASLRRSGRRPQSVHSENQQHRVRALAAIRGSNGCHVARSNTTSTNIRNPALKPSTGIDSLLPWMPSCLASTSGRTPYAATPLSRKWNESVVPMPCVRITGTCSPKCRRAAFL